MKKDNRNFWITKFVALAFIFSWSIEIMLALGKLNGKQILPQWTHYISSFGPFLSAVIITFCEKGFRGVNDLFCKIRFINTNKVLWLVSFSPILVFFLVSFFEHLIVGTELSFENLGIVKFLPPLTPFLAFLLWLFTFGFGEEIGWRGYALPKLQNSYSIFRSILVLFVIWAAWHIPQFFYSYEISMLPGWLISIFAGTTIFSWIINKSKGNVLFAILFHASFDFISASRAGESFAAMVVVGLIIVAAILVLMKEKLGRDYWGIQKSSIQ